MYICENQSIMNIYYAWALIQKLNQSKSINLSGAYLAVSQYKGLKGNA